MTNTSSPRTFSNISTNTSISAKRRILAFVSGILSPVAMASASGRLPLQATTFIVSSYFATGTGPRLAPQARNVSATHEAVNGHWIQATTQVATRATNIMTAKMRR